MTELETRKDVIDWYTSECHQIAADKGWWESGRSFPECIALVHSELSEALEEYRISPEDIKCMFVNSAPNAAPPEGISIELADVLIRIFDMCGKWGIPLGDALEKKIEFNRTRPYRHGGKLA